MTKDAAIKAARKQANRSRETIYIIREDQKDPASYETANAEDLDTYYQSHEPEAAIEPAY